MFLFHENSAVNFNDELPESVDVVIIGGGIIGITTAWYLLEQGKTVLVCDKGRVAGEQSSRNWGWVRVTGRDESEVPIARESTYLWEDLDKQLNGELGFTRGGCLAMAENQQEVSEFEQWMEISNKYDVGTRMLTVEQSNSLVGSSSGKWHGAMITDSDGRAEPFKAVPAIAKGVQEKGGMIRENCAVRTVEFEAGRISGVITEHGPVNAQAVLCASGVWSSLLLSNLGVKLPQLAVKGTVARTPPAPEIYTGAAAFKDVFIRRRQDGGYTVASGLTEHVIGANSFRYLFKFIPSMASASDMRALPGRDPTQQSIIKKSWCGNDVSPFESNRVLNPAPTKSAVNLMRKKLKQRIPALADVPFVETWAGMIDATPDVVPVMDETNIPGLFLATGFSGHGFGIGPAAGKVMANLICGNDTGHGLHRFRFSRFSDGSKMVPGPAI
jgi:glycine/D-amino acid oxidase-like deaminating enzyme